MGKAKVDEICFLMDGLDYVDRKDVFDKNFSFDNVGEDLNDKLVLISLVSLTYIKMKEKSPLITPLEILCSITGERKSNTFMYKFLENISIIVENFTYGITKIDSCGLKNSTEIINKIKEILGKWMPF